MSRCKFCNVHVSDSLTKCPLCFKLINEQPARDKCEYPIYNTKVPRETDKIVTRICLFLSIVTIVTCVFINIVNHEKDWWSVSVSASILYAWLLIKNTILSKSHVGAKILFQVLGLSVMVLLIDLSSDYHRWSVNFVIPFLVMSATLLITIIISTRNMRWSEYVGYQFAIILLGFIPILLHFLHVTDVFWVSSLSALYAFSTLVFMFIFSNKKFKAEFIRRFHF